MTWPIFAMPQIGFLTDPDGTMLDIPPNPA